MNTQHVDNAKHLSLTDKWYTPAAILEMARVVLGSIDLDPASDAFGNEFVLAQNYITEKECGLVTDWIPGTIWLNPPGGKIGNRSRTGLFWEKLMKHRDEGKLRHAIFMAFSAEALQNTQGKSSKPMMDFPICIPSKRIQFVSRGVEKTQPSHSNAIVYVPGKVNDTERFIRVFSKLGCCKR